MVKRSSPFTATAAHGIPGASCCFKTVPFSGSIASIWRRSREPIHNVLFRRSQARACGVMAGEARRCFSITCGCVMLNSSFGTKVRLISSSCNNAMQLVNLRAIDAECTRALLLTSGFSRVQKAKRRRSRFNFNGFPGAAKTVETVSVSVIADTGLKPGINKSSRLMFKNVCSPARTLPDSLPDELMKTRQLLGWTFTQYAVFAFGLFSAGTAGSGIITFQESSDASRDSKQQLVGHWRKTTIVFESAKAEHLVLRADGTAGNWVV